MECIAGKGNICIKSKSVSLSLYRLLLHVISYTKNSSDGIAVCVFPKHAAFKVNIIQFSSLLGIIVSYTNQPPTQYIRASVQFVKDELHEMNNVHIEVKVHIDAVFIYQIMFRQPSRENLFSCSGKS